MSFYTSQQVKKEFIEETHEEIANIVHKMDIEHYKACYYREGQAEGQAKERLRIGRAMLENGLDISIISECTSLTQEEILSIIKSR
ncbi:MAG: hypothetical protein LBE31_10905 [Deltaproteobacteria bacterium]|jgi:predicted transposase YdaD|nr:hypothetical protein [Deltaproteobacteria bacterium]